MEDLFDTQNSVKTVPNPADEFIQLEISLLFSKENTFLNVFDLEGRKLQSRTIGDVNDTLFVLDTRELTPGIYILEIIQDEKQIFTDKFIVQH
ncbi:T9SS type A sorting domain-containing protein [Cryomorpha ignava]|uniref:T9SS type A sorting domain-containing protein n=1 Tax=Cryomorpha ignava TaxID=101383 RepID=A0A7K3WP88_9FLAO|nr:T9SS type A sorting domain-containing protein [Cryomorpha ignava]NEN22831.1 T9SS type A sorting domain-containing protein [Cryomorpha ignava]